MTPGPDDPSGSSASGSSYDPRDPLQLPNPGLTDPWLQAGLWDGVDPAVFDARKAELVEGYRPENRMILAMADTRLTPTSRLVNAALAYSGWGGRISRGILAARLMLDPGNVSRALREIEKKTGLRIFRRRQATGHADFQYVFSGLDILEVQESRAKWADSARDKPPSQFDIQAGPPSHSDTKPPSQFDIQAGPPSHSDTKPPSQFDSEAKLPPSHSDTPTSLVTDLTDISSNFKDESVSSHHGDERASEKRSPPWYRTLLAAYPDAPPLSDFIEAAHVAGWDERRVASAGQKLVKAYIEPGKPVHAPLQLFKRIGIEMGSQLNLMGGERPARPESAGKYSADLRKRRPGG